MKNFSLLQNCLLSLVLLFAAFEGIDSDDVHTLAPKGYSEIRSETELQNLIDAKDFEGALQRLKDFPQEASIMVEIKDFNDALVARHMALHATFLVDIPTHLNDAKIEGHMQEPQVDLIMALLEANPTATAEKDLMKRNPLHLGALTPQIPPKRLIERLIEAYPPGLRTRDAEHRLPLHIAVSYPMTSLENIHAILKAYPDAVDVHDDDDALPIHLAAWGGETPQAASVIKLLHQQNPSNIAVRDGDSETVLSLMARYGRTTEGAIEYVVSLHPEAALYDRDEIEGNTILHFSVQSSHLNNNTIYKPVLKAYPEATKIINRVGQLPIHIALRHCCSSTQLIQDLLQMYPQAAKSVDGDGLLPLHHACQSGVADISVVTALVVAFPDSVKFTVVVHGEINNVYPIHLAMRHSSKQGTHFDTQNEIINLLLTKYPSGAKVLDTQVGLYPLQYALLSRRPVSILKKLMALNPDATSQNIQVIDKADQTKATTLLHIFASVAPTYLTPSAIKDMVHTIASYYPDCAKQKDGNGRLPLHEIWATVTEYNHESRNAMVEALLELYPLAVQIFDATKKSPLSYAVFQRDFSSVARMWSLHPEAAHSRALDGSFLLHQLCDFGAKGVHTQNIDNIMDLLLKANPQAAFEIDHDGDLPLHKLASSAGFEGVKKSTIQKLIESNPAATNKTNLNDRQPLMIAAISATISDSESMSKYWIDMVHALLQANPLSAGRHAVGGKTALTKILFDIDSLNKNRRREDDPLLQILKLLYQCHPQSVLHRDSRNRNALHVIATLLGDMAGMIPDSWKEFALTIMHDFPEIGSGVDFENRTPLFLYTLYLGDTAVGVRDSQDPQTTRYIDNIGELLHELIVLDPNALELKDEFGLTPLAQISSNRLSMASSVTRYNRSPIIKCIIRLLSRDSSFWMLANRFERPRHKFKRNIQAGNCSSLQTTYEDIRKELQPILKKLDINLNRSADHLSCKADWHEICEYCPGLSQLLATIEIDLSLIGEKLDERHAHVLVTEQ